MTINDHLDKFANLPVEDFDPEKGLESPSKIAYRLSLDYDEQEEGKTFADFLAALLADPQVGQLSALVVGCWGDMFEGGDTSEIVEALVSARDQLTGLRALFLADITCEECEISWINQSDISPLFDAYPELEELGVRGGEGLSLGRPVHECLKKLVIETGGLSGRVVREVAAAKLPHLEHLELWLGDPGYGNDITLDDLAPILAGDRFPNLRHLGLRDDANADETAKALAQSSVIERIEVLDLSLGTLGDEGGKALLGCPAVKRLKKLDLHYHFLSTDMMERLQQELGPERVDVSDRQEPDEYDDEEYRYVAVSE